MPAMAVDGIEIIPLEVAHALIEGDVVDGLVVFFADLERRRRPREPRN
jgi:hypothetical protein